jgi:cyclohexanecarboxylate-CoA ligase
MSRPGDPADLGTYSVGRPLEGVEVDLRSDGEMSLENPARLFVRSGSNCLATLGRDSGAVTVTEEVDDGFYATGDLAVPDGRGGLRILGRVADRIGGLLMIPVTDVEDALRSHPAVADVALVGSGDLDEKGFERACAVVVPQGEPPALEDLREHLSAQKMTEWYQPRRLEVLRRLPRNGAGKVQKDLLRRWVRGEAELPDELFLSGNRRP